MSKSADCRQEGWLFYRWFYQAELATFGTWQYPRRFSGSLIKVIWWLLYSVDTSFLTTTFDVLQKCRRTFCRTFWASIAAVKSMLWFMLEMCLCCCCCCCIGVSKLSIKFSCENENRFGFMRVTWNPQTKMTIVNIFCKEVCGRTRRPNRFINPILVDGVVAVVGKISYISLFYEIDLVGNSDILQHEIALKES